MWLMSGWTVTSSAAFGTVDLNWQIAGVGDFDGDGKADLVWRNTATGDVAMWLMSGWTVTNSADFATVDLNWQIAK
jgi:hypothetical protein